MVRIFKALRSISLNCSLFDTFFSFASPHHPLCLGHMRFFETYKAPSSLRAFVMLFALFFAELDLSCNSHLYLDITSSEKSSLTTTERATHSFSIILNSLLAPITRWYFSCLFVGLSPCSKIWAPPEPGALSCSPVDFQCLWIEFIQGLDWVREFSLWATRSIRLLWWTKESEVVAQSLKSLGREWE